MFEKSASENSVTSSKPVPPDEDVMPEQDKGQPARPKSVGDYMSNLGAGTGVDIGPGAAGEMGGAAMPDELPEVKIDELEQTEQIVGEFPDSGDLPHLPTEETPNS